MFFFLPALPYAYDFPKFYRAAYFPGEPRLEKDTLSSLDVSIAGGRTCKSRNWQGEKQCLLDIYGCSSMQSPGSNIKCKDPTNPADIALMYLSREPSDQCFGMLSFGGQFELIEMIISGVQNFGCGLFTQILVPIKRMSLCGVNYQDLSSTDCGSYPNAGNPYWNIFGNQFQSILNKYCLTCKNWTDTGIGDIALLFGWTFNYENTLVLDYIDGSAKIGVSLPTGRKKSIDRLFDITPGYDGHTGFPLILDGSLGAFDWITLGTHMDFIPFVGKTKEMRIKTDYNQCGILRLDTECIHVKKGSIFDICVYGKADHFARGLSLLVGYVYSKKLEDELTDNNCCCSDRCILNSDPIYKEWEMHTLNFLLEYDFGSDGDHCAPHISLFYNWQIAGKRVFITNMAGGTCGIDVAWDF